MQENCAKVKIDPNTTSTQIPAEVKNNFGKDVHAMTVIRVLHDANYNTCVARRKPLITIVN